jgi:16S rRNA (guanine527-N7)-methyltransferase
MTDRVLEPWLEALVATPGLTAISDIEEARHALVEDALKAAPVVRATSGAVIDVGSGGGSPGVPLAAAMPDRPFTLLEAERRKCSFLAEWTRELANVDVVWGRAEEQPVDTWGVALAKALAKPPVAAELCLPLVRPGGVAILWVGETADPQRVEVVATRLASELEPGPPGVLVLRKLGPTPDGFPRRAGMAKKRPLA